MKKRRVPLTHARLLEALRYDRKTGAFIWITTRRGQRPKVGDRAGSVNPGSKGYRTIGVDGFVYGAHRLAWFYVKGEWPECEIDHKNRERDDNKWRNLRPATEAEQRQNRGIGRNNKTGFTGVRLHRCGRYEANIGFKEEHYYLGLFDTAEQASRAYKKAKKLLHAFNPSTKE